MSWSELLIYTLLVLCGYGLARAVDRARAWRQTRDRSRPDGQAAEPAMPGTMRRRVPERQAVYGRFRKSVNAAVNAAVNDGHGSYGLLYQIRDDYGELLRLAPSAVSQSADSMIRCVTLLLNLGASDQRHAMYARALHQFDEACSAADGTTPSSINQRQEFSVLADQMADQLANQAADLSAPPSGIGSASAHAPT